MPTNLTVLRRNLETVRSQTAEELQTPRVLTQLHTSQQAVQNAAIPFDHSDIVIPAKNENELTSWKVQEQYTARQWRYQILSDLERLYKRASLADSKTGGSDLQKVNEAHVSLSELIEWVCEQDVDPTQVLAFQETENGRAVLIEASKAAYREFGTHNMREARAAIEKQLGLELASQQEDYLAKQFPRQTSLTDAPTLSERDVLRLGRELWSAFRHTKDAPESEIGATLAAGQKQNQWQIEDRFLTADYWRSAASNGFDWALPSYSEWIAIIQLQDRLTPTQALETIERNARSARMTLNAVDPVVTYLEDGSDKAPLATLGHDGANRFLVIADRNDNPLVVTSLHQGLADYAVVSAPGKNCKVAHLKSPDAEARLEELLSVAQELRPQLNKQRLTWIDSEIEKTFQQWRDLTVSNLPDLKAGLLDVHQRIHQLANEIPSPGAGSHAGRGCAQRLVELALLSGMPRDNQNPLKFRLPDALETGSHGIRPDAEVLRADNGDGTCDVSWHDLDKHGNTNDEPYRMARSMPTSQANQYIARVSRESGERVGIRPLNLPGLAVHDFTTDGQAAPVGHWVSESDRNKWATGVPHSLIYRNNDGSQLFNWNDDRFRTSEDAHELQEIAVELIHGGTLTQEQTMHAIEVASYDGDYLLDVEQAEIDLVGTPQFNLQAELFRMSSRDDLKTAICQHIAQSSLEQSRASVKIQNVQSGSWIEAKRSLDEMLGPYAEETDMPGPRF